MRQNKTGPKKLLFRNLACSLIRKERIKTTLIKAKVLRPSFEKYLTKAKTKDFNSRRYLLKHLNSQVAVDDFFKVAERFKERKGGYLRIIKLGERAGDKAPQAYIELVDFQPKAKEKKEDSAKKSVTNKSKVAFNRAQLKKKANKRKRIRKLQKSSRRINR